MDIQLIADVLCAALSHNRVEAFKQTETFLNYLAREGHQKDAREIADRLNQLPDLQLTIDEVSIYESSGFNNTNYGEYWNFLARKMRPDKATDGGEQHILQFDFLVKDCRLQPDDTFMDIGTGSLRGSRLVIPYLNKYRFYGMDVSDELIRFCKERVAENLEMAIKQPKFAIDG